MNRHFMKFDFGNIHYTQIDSGKEVTLVLLHAFHSSADSYVQLCERLKDHCNLVCLDFPGHGQSDHIDCEQYGYYYSMAGFTDVLVEFIARLGLTNYVIAGDSIGGNCTIRGLSKLPGIRGMILMGTAQARSAEIIFQLHHESEALTRLFQKHRTQAEDELVTAAYVDPSVNGGKNFQLMLKDIQRIDPNCREYLSAQIESQPWVDEIEILQQTTVPYCYILGEQDGFINTPYYRDALIEAGVKAEVIHVLPNCRHVPYLDDLSASARIMTDFIEQHLN